MVKKRSEKKKERKFLTNVTGKKLTVISILLMFLFGTIATLQECVYNKPEQTEVLIESLSLANDYLSCENRVDVTLFYSLYHISGERLGERQPYYERLNQTNNTCFNGTFFYDKFPLCYNIYTTGERVLTCKSKFEPLNLNEPTDALSYLNNETTNFLENMQKLNITKECQISEVIRVCAFIGGEKVCSNPSELTLHYVPCKS